MADHYLLGLWGGHCQGPTHTPKSCRQTSPIQGPPAVSRFPSQLYREQLLTSPEGCPEAGGACFAGPQGSRVKQQPSGNGCEIINTPAPLAPGQDYSEIMASTVPNTPLWGLAQVTLYGTLTS